MLPVLSILGESGKHLAEWALSPLVREAAAQCAPSWVWGLPGRCCWVTSESSDDRHPAERRAWQL